MRPRRPAPTNGTRDESVLRRGNQGVARNLNRVLTDMAIFKLLARLYLVYYGVKALAKIISKWMAQRRAKQPPSQTPTSLP
jgi:hypothetical protein